MVWNCGGPYESWVIVADMSVMIFKTSYTLSSYIKASAMTVTIVIKM